MTHSPDTIKTLRASLGLTQEQFAALVGVTFSTVNRWETGKSKPSKHTAPLLDALAKKAARA
jgi:putative transcriptional regulator